MRGPFHTRSFPGVNERSRIVILLLIFILSFILNEPNIDANKHITIVEDERIITWDSQYQGDVFYYRTTTNGIEKYHAGYADGSGNYYISGFKVNENETLIIESGVNVIFDKGYATQFKVFGSLKVNGERNNEVVFKNNETNDDHWSGIYINEGESSIIINFCSFINGRDNVFIREVFLYNCIFQSSGIRILNENKLLSNVILKECHFNGELMYDYTFENIVKIEIIDCSFYNSKFDYFIISDTIDILFKDNIFFSDTNYISMICSGKLIFNNNIIDIGGSITVGGSNGESSIISNNKIKWGISLTPKNN